MKLATAAQMRGMDAHTADDYAMPSLLLMENAAHSFVDVLAERFSPLQGKRIVVACGGGNNGGDGFAIARHLHARCGARVHVVMAADPNALTGDAAVNYDMARKFGVPITQAAESGQVLPPAELIVDALLGTGARGPIRPPLAFLITQINEAGRPVISVDVPSGLNADTGNVDEACVQASLTVTFALPKYGLMVYPGTKHAGEIVTVDIGFPRAVQDAPHVTAFATEKADVARWLPARAEAASVNKGTFGHAVLVAGSAGFAGAAALCADAAARAGAGLVTLLVPESAQNPIVSLVSPVVMTRGLPQTGQGTFALSALDAALEMAGRGTAAAVGPGVGASDPETAQFVRQFVRQCPVPLVIDADALNILAGHADVVKGRSAPAMLTPHPGEMGRLLGMTTDAVQSDRRGAAERATSEYGCVVLLKGARTLVAAPDGRLWVNTTGNAGMATGGAGDTLTGMVAALLAGGLEAGPAAACGAYLHGLAGDLAAKTQGGKTGLLATDIAAFLPRAIAQCQQEAAI